MHSFTLLLGGKGLGSRSPSTMSLRNPGSLVSNGGGGGGTLAGGGGGGLGPDKGWSYKHQDLMNLTAVRRVVDLDGDDCKECFAMVCRTNEVFGFEWPLINQCVNKMIFFKQCVSVNFGSR